MAHVKNSNRSKRKYGPAREARTEANRKRKQAKREAREIYLLSRTEALVGKTVRLRSANGNVVGTVLRIVRAPEGSVRRHGNFLEVNVAGEVMTRSRHRAKLV